MNYHQRILLMSGTSIDRRTRPSTNVIRRILVAAAISFCVTTNQSQARLMEVITYREMLAKSDLVVIATPKSKTTDTGEHALFPNMVKRDEYGGESKVESIGVETVFVVSAVLKGDNTIKKFTLHHYREGNSSHAMVNGPLLVFFDPSDPSKINSYLLFLVREPDGRFAPTGGQTDPGYKAINPLPQE
jgi:hypothetical protein